jgi:hypothetical protein
MDCAILWAIFSQTHLVTLFGLELGRLFDICFTKDSLR